MSAGFNDFKKLSGFEYQALIRMEQEFPDEYAVRAAMYHLQQAVEKGLKALILYHGEFPEFTHDIDKLLNHCKKLGEAFSENSEIITEALTMWEAKSRYDPYISFSQKKYDMAKDLYSEIRDKLAQTERSEEQQ